MLSLLLELECAVNEADAYAGDQEVFADPLEVLLLLLDSHVGGHAICQSSWAKLVLCYRRTVYNLLSVSRIV